MEGRMATLGPVAAPSAAQRAIAKANGSSGRSPETRERPTVIMATGQAATGDRAGAALAGLGLVYVRARTLVQVVRDVSESHGLEYPDGSPVITRVKRERLRELAGRAAIWVSARTL